jgi:hypothetical protein
MAHTSKLSFMGTSSVSGPRIEQGGNLNTKRASSCDARQCDWARAWLSFTCQLPDQSQGMSYVQEYVLVQVDLRMMAWRMMAFDTCRELCHAILARSIQHFFAIDETVGSTTII